MSKCYNKPMKRSGFKPPTLEKVIAYRNKPRKPLQASGFSPGKPKKPKLRKRLKHRELMPQRVNKAKSTVYQLSHNFVRQRDSEEPGTIGGFCFDCGKYDCGGNFQAGHWIPDSVGGALLRYHPRNMHGQIKGCNMKVVQERVKINYTFAMIKKYGTEYVEKLRMMQSMKTVKADIIFYERLIELYKAGDEQAICDFLESF